MIFFNIDALDPFILFNEWLQAARSSEINDPDAACLATVGADGKPSARMVLLRGYGPEGFWFNTNSHSHKGRDIAATGVGAMCIHWKSLRRQIRIEGAFTKISDAESDAYFATRPRGSQIGAWASEQSAPLESMEALREKVRAIEAKYEGQDIPRPPHWHGYRLVPDAIEFWADGEFRLHERLLFTKGEDGHWNAMRLNP